MKLNKRGYMLVEIILASAIAFGMAYFMLNMTIKLKNKNDDLLVETLVSTDQTIIMNSVMRSLKGTSCDGVYERLKIDERKVSIDNTVIDVISDYATIDEVSCDYSDNIVTIKIPISVIQLENKKFDIELNWIFDDN